MRVVHVLRKPLSEGTVASNVVKHGCGGLNIDGSRVAHANPDDLEAHRKMDVALKARGGSMDNSWKNSSDLSGANDVPTGGRWPANVILQHLDGCRCDGIKRVKGAGWRDTDRRTTMLRGNVAPAASNSWHHVDKDGKETVANWICELGCPVAALDEQSGVCPSTGNNPSTAKNTSIYRPGQPPMAQGRLYADTGGASRFFKQVGGKTDG
jgi:hypothetical protein